MAIAILSNTTLISSKLLIVFSLSLIFSVKIERFVLDVPKRIYPNIDRPSKTARLTLVDGFLPMDRRIV